MTTATAARPRLPLVPPGLDLTWVVVQAAREKGFPITQIEQAVDYYRAMLALRNGAPATPREGVYARAESDDPILAAKWERSGLPGYFAADADVPGSRPSVMVRSKLDLDTGIWGEWE